MKALRMYNIFIISSLLIFLMNCSAWSQQSQQDWDLIMIREDNIKPAMTEDYERSLTDLKNFLEEGGVKDFGYFTYLQDDYHYVHASPIEHVEDIDKGMLEYVAQQADRAELNLILEDLNSTIESYRNYLVQYMPELSYVPGTNKWNEGQPYRRWNFLYFSPGSERDVEMILKSWKGLYKKHATKYGFRVYKGFIGVTQPMYILTTWAEDPLDFQQNLRENTDKFNLEGAALWTKMREYAIEANTVEGWYLPQYSYTAGLVLAE